MLSALRGFRSDLLRPIQADATAWRAAGYTADGTGMRSHLGLAFRFSGYRATILHRMAHWAHLHRVPGLPTVLHGINLLLHGIEITPGTSIGPGLYMAHTAGSVITAASIGQGVELQGGITIGTKNRDGFPTICDGVTISCGARVLGSIVVGPRATVGANSVVLSNVEPDCTVVGAPARPVRITVP